MPIAVRFQAAEALAAAVSGGKGANLARLAQAALPVPQGFVLSADAYALFIGAGQQLLADVDGFSFEDAAVLERQCGALLDGLTRLPFPQLVKDALIEHLAALGASTPVSVRSSATTEDLGGAAFAGQHETYLNCIGVEEIAARVQQCWASLWSGRAVAYRRAAGFDLRATGMAVVIQRMAFCEVAGVGFSFNPVSGNLGEQVFDANYGLGESVVGGEAQIDHFTLDKSAGTVISQQIARKEFMILAEEHGSGTRSVRIDDAVQSKPCLAPQQLKELSELLGRIERLYGFPQDIEWGFEHGALRLLQSRPITRIPARWTRDESAERFPSVITPLAWALVEEGFHKSLNYSFALMGVPPFHDKWFAMFDHYIYGNQNAVEVYANGAASGIRVESIADLVAAAPLLRERYGWVLELPMAWSRDLDYYLICIGELMVESLEGRSVAELWQFVLRVKELGADYFLPNIAISITQRTLYRVLHGLLKISVGSVQAPAVFDKLLAYCETKTGVINKELHRFAGRIGARAELRERLQRSNAEEFLRDGGFGAYPDLHRVFEKFLRDHGHREVEFDPYHPTWLDAPALVIENLKAMLESHRDDPAIKERELKMIMSETEAALLARVPEEVRFLVREIIRLARVYTTLDDVEHYQTTRLTLPLRKGIRALGVRLVSMGVLDDPMDVYFADYRALGGAVQADTAQLWAELRSAIRAEKSAYLRHKHATPIWEWGQEKSLIAPSDRDLTGLPGSPGTAAGAVFRVFGSEDFGTFPKGAVLVARTTNPAWTPLFFKAAAVITECGGPLSHGAVTAREIGLPAVMSVRDALSVLRNGQMVVVDGTAGRVQLTAVQ